MNDLPRAEQSRVVALLDGLAKNLWHVIDRHWSFRYFAGQLSGVGKRLEVWVVNFSSLTIQDEIARLQRKGDVVTGEDKLNRPACRIEVPADVGCFWHC